MTLVVSVIDYLFIVHQPYGRNWSFLWAVPIAKWKILLLVAVFFVGVWAAMLVILTHFSKTHTWLLPVFAVGLGAPRWCQVCSILVCELSLCIEMNGTDVVGYVLASLVYPLGWLGRSLSGHLALALAWRPRCYPGCGIGHDSSPGNAIYKSRLSLVLTVAVDAVAVARLCYARLLSNHWFGLRHGRSSHCSRQNRT